MTRKYGHWFVRRRLSEQGFTLTSDFKNITGAEKVEYICKKCGKKKSVLVSSVMKGIKCGHRRKPHPKEKEKLRSKGYSEWREDIKFVQDYRCQKSGSPDFLTVHHMISIQRRKDLILCPHIGLLLKEDLHEEFHKEFGDIDFRISDNFLFLGFSEEEAHKKEKALWVKIDAWLEEQDGHN